MYVEVSDCDECSCVPDAKRDCLVDVLELHPGDLDVIKRECDNQTDCQFVVSGADLTQHCGTNTTNMYSDFIRVNYACTDGKSGRMTLASCQGHMFKFLSSGSF